MAKFEDVLLRLRWLIWRILLQPSHAELQSPQPHGIAGRHRDEMLLGTPKGGEKRALQ